MSTYTGIVQPGTKYATTLGFPTVNIPLLDKEVSGIYAARVTIDEKTYLAAVYADQKRGLLEAHLLDFAGDLYGKELSIELGAKVREDRRFESDAALRAAIEGDVQRVRQLLSA